MFAILPDKREKKLFVNSNEGLVLFPVPKNYKCRFWSSPINKIFPDPVITGCKFHFSHSLWRQLQYIHLNAGIQRKWTGPTHIILCAVLAYLITNKAEEVWPMIMENVPQNKKLTLLLAFYVQQLMKNQNVPIEMWNINKHRNRTKNVAEG
jgi:hypothetical protein